MEKNILRNESAVSPVLGAILIMAIGVTLLSTVQMNFVPVWNTQEELDHLKVMVDDFKVLKSGIESGIQSGTTSSLPLSMGFKYSPKVLVYNPKESAYASLDIQENTWAEVRYNEVFPDGMTDDTSIKNVTTSTITYALKGASNYNAFLYEHGLIRRKGSDYTTNSQTILANNTIDLLSVKPLGSETTSSVEKKTVNIYPTSQQKNSVIGKNVWLILHTKPEYVNWWNSILRKEGGQVKMTDTSNGIVITYIDSTVIKMGEAYISTASKAAPAHAPQFRIIKISQENFLPVEGTSNLVVEIQDRYNNPVPNVQVNFNINKTRPPGNANSGTLLQNQATSGADGRATVILKTGGAGFYYIEASTPDGNSTTFAIASSSQGGVLTLSPGSGPPYVITATLTDGLGNNASDFTNIFFNTGDGNLSVENGQIISGSSSTTLDITDAKGIKITNVNSSSTTYNSTVITWDTFNNITVTARSGYIFNSIVVPTNVITSGCVQFGTVSGGPYPNIRCDLTPPSSSHSVSLTGLEANTAYYFKVNGSNGTRSSTSTEYLFVTGEPETTPASVTNLSYTSGPLYIKWTWDEPAGVDHVELYVDNPPAMVVSGQQYFNASYFMPNSTHTIYIRTVDIDGHANTSWMNLTAYTPTVFDYVFNLSSITFGTVNNFNNARSDNDSGASAQFYEINTPAVPDSYNDTFVTFNNDTLGTTTSFVNMQNDSDGGAYATLTEGLNSGVSQTTIVANSSGNTGFSAQTTSENLYATTITNAQVGARTTLTAANLNSLSVDDTSYVIRTGSNAVDAIMVVNFTKSDVASVNWVSLKFVGTVTTNSESLQIGLYNATSPAGGGWTKLNATKPAVGTYITMTYNVSSQSDKDKYLVLSGNTLTLSFAEWVNGTANSGLSNNLYEITVNYVPVQYAMNITFNISAIPVESSSYTLQTNYKLGNTNESGYNMDIWNFASSTWGNTQSLTSTSWIQNNVTLTSDQISGGQVKTRFIDQTPAGTAPGDLFIDFQRILGFTAGTTAGYHLDITTDTNDIPEANTLPELQLKYTVSGGNFTVLIKNGTTSGWDSVTTLNSSGSYRNITLTLDELLLYGTFSGNMPAINKYYVQVRYQDESPLLNGTLNLDYQRVYSS